MTIAPLSARAQDGGTNAAESPRCSVVFENDASGSYGGGTDMKGAGKGLGDVSSYDLKDTFQCTVNALPGIEFDAGTTYHRSYFEADHESAAPMVKRLHDLTNDFTVKWAASDKWIVVGNAGFGWYNSGSNFNSHGLGVSVAAGAVRNFGENLSVMAGVGYNSLARHDRRWMPGLGVSYVISPRWSVSLGYPQTAVTYVVTGDFTLSLVAEGECQTYHVRAADLKGDASGRIHDGKMEFTDVRTGLRADYKINSHLSASVTAGWLFEREFDFYDNDYKMKSDGGAPYAGIALNAKF